MDTHPYHHYLFFHLHKNFYQLPETDRKKVKSDFRDWLNSVDSLILTPYATLGFKTKTTFMLWCRGKNPADVQLMLPHLMRTGLGSYLKLTYTYFGIVRPSQYSGRVGKPEQVMQNFEDRLPYFILYPFTKTAEWYFLEFEDRKSMMGEHIKIGVGHPEIRQCLLYSFGIDDYEFIVSYETGKLEEFQDLVMELRKTAARQYTAKDTPIHTCIYKPVDKLMEWL